MPAPCWGEVVVIDHDYDEDSGDFFWVHGCAGHILGYGGPYIPEEEDASNQD